MNTNTSTTLNVTHQYTPITPSNTTDFPSLTRAIYVGGDGNVAVVRFDGTVVTFTNVAAGSVLPVSARRVNSTGTTASGLCALFGRLERTPFWVPNSFSPLDLSPVLWLDAADTSTITESGGAVSQWDNKGSLGDFTQGTAAVQPTTGVTTQNGLNVIDFAADYLTSADAASAYNDLHNGTDYIVAAVVKFGTTANPNALYTLLGTNGGSLTNIGCSLSYDDRSSIPSNDRIRVQVANSVPGAGAPVLHFSGDGFFAANTMSVLSSLQDPDNATAADRSQLALNAGSLVTNNTNTGTPTASNATYAMQVGADGVNASPLTGSIAELIIVTGANATESNRQALRDYLNNKWSVY